MRIIIITFFLAILSSAFSQNCKTYFSGQFVPKEQIVDDSVFYLVSLSNLYELHANKEYRITYDIRWFDHCKFNIIADESSDSENPIKSGAINKCSAQYTNDSNVQLQLDDKTLFLSAYKDGSVWSLMSKRDRELKKNYLELDSTIKALEDLKNTGDSLNAILNLFAELPKLMDNSMSASQYERDAISLMFTCLKDNNWEMFYNNGSTKFKDQIEKHIIQQYFKYLWNVYGRWEYFEVQEQSTGTSLFGSQIDVAGTSKFIFNVKFEKCIEDAEVTIILSEENDIQEPIDVKEGSYITTEGVKTFQTINVVAKDLEPSSYLDSLTSDFFAKFYKKQYSKIYQDCSPNLKAEASKDQVENILSLANSMRNNIKYKLFRHLFSIDKKYGGLITVHYVAEMTTKDLYLSLTYTTDLNSPKLAGLNFKERIKK